MEGKFLKLSLKNKDIYFKCIITKYFAYSSNIIEFQDYHIVIKEVIYDNGEDELEGLFLFVDENKKIRIYDIEKKVYVDVEDNEDIHYLCYFYGSKKYFLSLENVIKEIIFNIMINK